MLEKDKVVIIIASYNGIKYWSSLMPLLVKQKYDQFEVEILVVDNNSSDSTVEFLKNNYPEIKLICNPENTGFVGANNIGYQYAKKAGAKYIYLLNQDTEVSPDFLLPLYDFAESNDRVGSLQSKLRLWPKKDRINTIGNAIHFLGFGYSVGVDSIDENNQKIKKINYSSGAGVFLPMKVLENKGGLFDETMFMYLEDLDLGWQLSMLGYDNYLIPSSIVYHKYEFDRGTKHYFWFERNRLWVMLKNYKIGTMILIFPAWLLMEIAQLFYAMRNSHLKDKLKSYSFLFSKNQRSILFSQRRYIQSKRKRGDRQIFGNFTGLILFQPLNSLALHIANIIFFVYFKVIKLFIFW